MNIHEKLLQVQDNLNAPKNQFNKFGGYSYRNLEDINVAVKPLLLENGLSLTLTDLPVVVGTRTYIQSTATLTDIADPDQKIQVSGYAREAETKKGMDDSQITGAASSYARKYCLNGLFAIDDTKDADATQGNSGKDKFETLDDKQVSTITDMMLHVKADGPAFLTWIGANSIDTIPKASYNKAITALRAKEAKNADN